MNGRSPFAFSAAGVVTFGLFFTMQDLVAYGDEVNLDEGPVFLHFDATLEDIPETTPKTKDWDVEKPEDITEPPVIDDDITFGDPEGPQTGLPEIPISHGDTFGEAIDFGNAITDGDQLPLVRVQPQYPRHALERGIEGYAIVELTVDATGGVQPGSINIVESVPDKIFDREAIKAAQKFKYKPKVVNGVAQAVPGVRYRFSFNLAND